MIRTIKGPALLISALAVMAAGCGRPSILLEVVNTDRQPGLAVSILGPFGPRATNPPANTDPPSSSIELDVEAGSTVRFTSEVSNVIQSTGRCQVGESTLAGGSAVISVTSDTIICQSGWSDAVQ